MKTKLSGDFLCSGRASSQALFLRLKDSKSTREVELRAVSAPTELKFSPSKSYGQQWGACTPCSGRQDDRRRLGTRAGPFILPRVLRDGCCFLLHSLISGSGLCQKCLGSGDGYSLFPKL